MVQRFLLKIQKSEKHNTHFCLQLKPLFMRDSRDSPDFTDEPTGNLDTRNTSEVIALLKEASHLYEQTIVMITHSQRIAQAADRILRVSDGVVTDFGRCRES